MDTEKREWLKEIGAKRFRHPMRYCSKDGHLYSEEYIRDTPIEKLKASYPDNINFRKKLNTNKTEGWTVDINIKIEGLEEFLAELEDGIDEINNHIENKLKDLAEHKISIIAEVNGGD